MVHLTHEHPELGDVIVVPDVEALSVAEALEIALASAKSEGIILPESLAAPEPIGHGVMLCTATSDARDRPILLFATLRNPLPDDTPDDVPARHVLAVIGHEGGADAKLVLLARLARAFANPRFRAAARRARTRAELIAAYTESLAQAARTTDDDTLQPSGRFGGGLLRDVRGYVSRFGSDFRDGLHPKVIASTSFLYFACLAPAVAFGALMSEKTSGAIGALEMIAATALCGVVYALFSAQPLVILGGTGPLLVFTAVLFDLCRRLSLPFLPTYGWVGLWTMVFLVIGAVTEASRLVRHLTRFTDEIFAALISVIFIVEAVSSTIRVASDGTNSSASGLLSVLLVLGTYQVARSLSALRKTPYLRRSLRDFLADFGPAIAMATMGYVAYRLKMIDLPSLDAPAKLEPTSGRPWLVPLTAAPMWLWFASAIPALLVTILLFLDQNITLRIINAPSHHLKKPHGYHQDLLLLGVLVGVCSVIGLPWLVAATVRSLNHLRSLASYEAEADGELRMVAARETRTSNLLIHLLVGGSLLLLPILSKIPLPIVYGLFLYMGVASLGGNQFVDRVRLFVTDPQQYPETHYLKRVPRRAVHGFTALQLAGLIGLWLVKISALAILFPVAILGLIPLRRLADRLLGERVATILDAEAAHDEEVEERRVD